MNEEEVRQDPFEDGMDAAEDPMLSVGEEQEEAAQPDDPTPEEQEAEPAAAAAAPGAEEDELDTFARLFPAAAEHPETIPDTVWQAVREGADLSLAYALHQLDQSRSVELARQNAARSTGSMRSSGADRAPRDPFLEGWDD